MSLIIVSTIITILLIETVLWLFNFPPYPERHFSGNMLDDEAGFTLRNDSSTRISSWEYDTIVKVNNAGFRDFRDVTKGFKPDIFVLGDSFTMGHGVNEEDSLPSQLQSIMTKENVINLGVNAYSTAQEVIRFKRYINYFSHKPNYAVLVFYVGNDYHDNRRYNDSLNIAGVQVQTSYNGFVVSYGVKVEVIDNSLVWEKDGEVITKTPYNSFNTPMGYENAWLDWSKLYNMWAWFNKLRFKSCNLPIAIPGLYDNNFDFENSSEWVYSQEALNDFIVTARENDIKPYIVIMPSKYQLNPEILGESGCDIGKLDTESSVSFLERFLDKKNVAYVNLLEKFRDLSYSNQEKLYYTIDSHLTPYGNSIAAKIIAKEM